MNKKRALSNSRFQNQGYGSITYTFGSNDGFIELEVSPRLNVHLVFF